MGDSFKNYKNGHEIFFKRPNSDKLETLTVFDVGAKYITALGRDNEEFLLSESGDVFRDIILNIYDLEEVLMNRKKVEDLCRIGKWYASKEEYEKSILNTAFIKFQRQVYDLDKAPHTLTMEKLNKARSIIFE